MVASVTLGVVLFRERDIPDTQKQAAFLTLSL